MTKLSDSLAAGLSQSLLGPQPSDDDAGGQIRPVDGLSYVAGDRTTPLRLSLIHI